MFHLQLPMYFRDVNHQSIKMFYQLGPNSYSGRQFVTKFGAT